MTEGCDRTPLFLTHALTVQPKTFTGFEQHRFKGTGPKTVSAFFPSHPLEKNFPLRIRTNKQRASLINWTNLLMNPVKTDLGGRFFRDGECLIRCQDRLIFISRKPSISPPSSLHKLEHPQGDLLPNHFFCMSPI